MELAGKKVNFLGDSITQGAGASAPEHRYVNVFAAKTGATARNFGIGGTRISRSEFADPNPVHDQCFLDRVEGMDADADIIVVFGGTNDFGHGNGKLGLPSDTDEYTFYGALDSLCRRLIERYPTATLLFMTPLHRRNELATTNERGRPCSPLIGYVRAIREVAERYSIPVLDLYACSGIAPQTEIGRATYAPDGLHPNDRGAERIADLLISFLRNTL